MNSYPRQVPRKSRNPGFTLLEVLVTSLLASVVLVALWSLSDIYLRVFAAGHRKIEETQLVRCITQLFAKDISQVIQLPEEISPRDSGYRSTSNTTRQVAVVASEVTPNQTVAKPPSGSDANQMVARSPAGTESRPPTGRTSPSPDQANSNSSSKSAVPESGKRQADRSSPKFGLFGTKQALRLIVLQTDPHTVREPKDLAEVLPQPGQNRPPIASEFRTIEYTFSGLRDTSSSEQQHPPGLIRREWAWETWIGLRMLSQRTADAVGFSDMLPDIQADWTSEETLAVKSEDDDDQYHVPQVMGLEFHYYDGENWESEWNSWERRKLPLLVEVMLQIKCKKEETGAESEEELLDETEGSLSRVDENTSGNALESSADRGTIYRRVIHLPFAESTPIRDSRGRIPPQGDSLRTSPQLGANRP